jgi:tripartite-type tricarboxylate transporter receptor subunit TctC
VNRRELLRILGTLAPGATLLPAQAQDGPYPSKPVRFVIASTPGGLLDAVSRLYADRMAAHLKQSFVPDNIGGAASMIAARQVIKAKPDGYTLMTASNTIVTMPHLTTKAGYAMQDFTPVGEMCRSPSLLAVSSSSPFKSVADLVAAAKKSPGQLSFASGGVGTTSHLPAELFTRQAGISATHVPYKAIAQAIPDVISGRVTFVVVAPTSLAALIESGALRPLAITSDVRSPKFADVPTFKELGYPHAGFEIWTSILAPAGLPKAIQARLAEAMEVARADQDLIKRLDGMGQVISNVRTPEQFGALLHAEEDKISKLIKAANIVVE